MDKTIVYFLLLSSTSYVFAQNDDNPCVGDQVLNTAGDCVDADVSRNIYVYGAPDADETDVTKEVSVPKPKLEYNIVFVRAPEAGAGSEPIVVPPPQQKTIVYVLSKKGEEGNQPIIEVPAPPKYKPEVYYVNYAEGENPVLPGGVDLQTALDSEAQSAEEVGAEDAPAAGGAPAAEVAPAGVATGYSPPTAPAASYSAPNAPSTTTTTTTTTPASVAPQAPSGGSSQSPAPQSTGIPQAQPQQPNFVFVTPQPNVFVSPQGGLGSFQPQFSFQPQGNFQPQQVLGNFQQLGFPGLQG